MGDLSCLNGHVVTPIFWSCHVTVHINKPSMEQPHQFVILDHKPNHHVWIAVLYWVMNILIRLVFSLSLFLPLHFYLVFMLSPGNHSPCWTLYLSFFLAYNSFCHFNAHIIHLLWFNGFIFDALGFSLISICIYELFIVFHFSPPLSSFNLTLISNFSATQTSINFAKSLMGYQAARVHPSSHHVTI